MQNKLYNLKNEILAQLESVQTQTELENLRAAYLGKKGRFTLLLKEISSLPPEERPVIGRIVNEIKKTIENSIKDKNSQISSQSVQKYSDFTLPGHKPSLGSLHPQTYVLEELIDIFKQLGYQVADGPEIENRYYNFESLNFPKDHPALDTQQTLVLKTENTHFSPGEIILRTQTSAMQVRVMEKTTPPLRVIVPGKCFRYDQVDASHGFEFWQLEGFLVDQNIKLTDLFGTLSFVLKKIMGENLPLRFACTNFPFVEPGVDTYIQCTVCSGKGCSFCKNSGWSEIMPAGMIHPRVLKYAHINPEKYTGFAFAIGLSRLVTLRFGMEDLRLLTNPDLRIIQQF